MSHRETELPARPPTAAGASRAAAARSGGVREAAPREGSPQPEDEARVRRVCDRIECLPTLPEVVTRILQLVDDPKIPGNQVADVVSCDQATSAAVLKLVNAPFYGLRRRISSIHQAVTLLGFRAVRNLALSAVLVRNFGEPSRDRRFDRAALWKHAVACGIGSRSLARRLAQEDAEEAFLAGLVHDMGLVILDQYFHEEFQRVLDLVLDAKTPQVEAEREVVGTDHAQIGGWLSRRWNFPASVTEAVTCHHEPWKARRAETLAAIVHVANACGPGSGPEAEAEGEPTHTPSPGSLSWERDPIDPRAMERLGLQPNDIVAFRLALLEEWDGAQDLVRLLA